MRIVWERGAREVVTGVEKGHTKTLTGKNGGTIIKQRVNKRYIPRG